MFYKIVTCVLLVLSLQFVSAVSAKVARADCGTVENPCSGGEIQGWQPDAVYGGGGAQSPPPGEGWQPSTQYSEDYHGQQGCGNGGIRCPGYPPVILEMDANSRQPVYVPLEQNIEEGYWSNDLQLVRPQGEYLWQGQDPHWVGQNANDGIRQEGDYTQMELGTDGNYHQTQWPPVIEQFNGQANPGADYYRYNSQGQFYAPVLPDPAQSNDEVIWY